MPSEQGDPPVVRARVTRLRSLRCERCRWRKIKCDEDWPNCGPCTKAHCPCSGPPIIFETGFESPSLIQPMAGSMEIPNMESRVLSSLECANGSFSCIRLSSPRPYPTTVADRVASRLTAYLERGSLLAADYFWLLPARLGSSVALRNTVNLFCIFWGRVCRTPSSNKAYLKAYGSALRSLQYAISGEDNAGNQLACETLAAASIMYRFELLFGEQVALQSKTHSHGIYSLMAARGPPDLNDDLDVCLAFENQIVVTNHILSQGGDNFYLRSDWKEALSQASHNTTTSQALIDHYYFSRSIQGWPKLVSLVKCVTSGSNDRAMRTINAAIAWKYLNKHKANLDKLHGDILAKIRYENQMTSWDDQESLTHSELNSADSTLTQRLFMFTSSMLVLNRLMRPILNIICIGRLQQIDVEHRRLSELVLHHMNSGSPGLSIILASPLALLLEGMEDDVRHALITIEKLMLQNRPKGIKEEEANQAFDSLGCLSEHT